MELSFKVGNPCLEQKGFCVNCNSHFMKIRSSIKSVAISRARKEVCLGMGVLTSEQMSTTLATASIGLQYGIFKQGVFTSLVFLSIVSIVVAPFLAELAFGVKVEKPSKFELFWRGKTVGETM